MAKTYDPDRLDLDASGYIAAQTRVAEAINKSNFAMIKFNRLQYQLFTGMNQSYAFNQAWTNLTKQEKAIRSLTDAQERYRKGVILTANELSRLLTVLIIRDAFYSFVGAMKASLQETEQFAIKVSEVQTIAQRTTFTFDQWSESIRKLSDASGRALTDVTEGLYQTLSNQIGQGTEAIQFMTKALEFSRVSVSTTADSVNLLSAVINSFRLNVYDTDKIAASLFKTIELGRVRATEMADTFGRVGVIASRLGVSLYETEAAVATLTIQGVKFADASTQVTNILNKLIKPSKDMQELFKEWGVTSGEAAIQTFGFAGVLQKLETASHGSSQELAELFRDIRATRGILGLTGGAFDQFTNALKQVQNQTDYLNAKQIVATNLGKDWEVQLNQLKNLFVADFGRGFLEFTLSTVNHLGGLVPLTKQLVVALGSATAAYITFRIARAINNSMMLQEIALQKLVLFGLTREQAAARLSAQAWYQRGLAIRGFLNPVNLITIGIGIATYAYLKHEQTLDEVAQAYNGLAETAVAASQKQTDVLVKNNQIIQDSWLKGIDVRYQRTFDFFVKVNKLENQSSDILKENLVQVAADIKEAFDNSFKSLELSINKINHLSVEAKNNAERAKEIAVEIAEKTNARVFEAGLLRLSPDQQLAAIKNKIVDTQTTLATALNIKNNQDPEKAKHNLALANKVIVEQEKLFGDIEQRRARAAEKIKTLEAQILEIRERQSAHDTIEEDHQDLTQAQRLSRKKNRHRKTDSPHDQLTSDTEAEHDREVEVRLTKLQQELDIEQSILNTSLSDSEALRVKNDYAKEQVSLLEKYAKLQEQISANQSKQAEELRKQLEASRILFEELGNKFKVDNTLKTAADKEKLLTRFDSLVSGSIASGSLTDQNVIYQLSQKRIALEAEADDKIRQHKLETLRATATESERILKEQVEAGFKKKNEISSAFIQDVNKLKELNKQITDAANSFAYTRGSGGQTVEENEKFASAINTRIDAFFKNQNSTSLADLSKTFEFANTFRPPAITGATIKDATPYSKAITVTDLINEFSKTLHDANKQIQTQNDLSKTQRGVDAQLNALGVQRQKIEQDFNTTLKKFGDEYINHIGSASNALQGVTSQLKQLEAELIKITGKQNKTVSLDQSVNPSSAIITINYTASGAGTQTDAVALAKAIDRERRRGTV